MKTAFLAFAGTTFHSELINEYIIVFSYKYAIICRFLTSNEESSLIHKAPASKMDGAPPFQ